MSLKMKFKSLISTLENESGGWQSRKTEGIRDSDYGVNAAVLDLLLGFIAETKRRSHVLLKSLLIEVEEKLRDHSKVSLWHHVIK